MLLLARGHTLRASGLFSVRTFAIEVGLGALGIVMAALLELNPWLVPAVVAPLLLTHRSFSNLAAARESEGRFRAMFESAPIGAALIGFDGRCPRDEHSRSRDARLRSGELDGVEVGTITHPDDVDADSELLAELVEGKRDRYELEKRYRAKDGALVWGRLAVLARPRCGREAEVRAAA